MRYAFLFATVASLVVWVIGCQKPVRFPTQSLAQQAKAAGALEAYDTNGSGQADFFVFANSQGRIDRIGYSYDDGDKPHRIVNLDALSTQNVTHLVIILDGFGYEVVRKFYDEGHLRLCYPPSRVIAPYPTLTDLCMEDLLGYIPCHGIEAEYFDRKQNRVVGGNGDYLSADNMPYNRLLDYRAGLLFDAISYVKPWAVYGKELNDIKRMLDRHDRQEVLAYIVSSAGMGTREGAQGQRRCLESLERLVNQIVFETQGQIRLTILADHGHSYTPSTMVPLEGVLKQKGWRLANRLERPKDVVWIRFGLVTFAGLYTRQAPELAADAITTKGVELASYVENDTVVVLDNAGGKAVIHHGRSGYKYQAVSGDPLKLGNALASLADANGYVSDQAELNATADLYYPAPLQRLWRAHFDLVDNPPDVILSLADDTYSGSEGFSRLVKIASTHGSLNRSNTTTFIMSSIGPLPPIMESKDIPRNLKTLTGREFPSRK